jgi:hypothetical protein
MQIIAETILEAETILNLNAEPHLDFQLDGDIMHEYNHKDEDKSIEWSWEEKTHKISGQTLFEFYC